MAEQERSTFGWLDFLWLVFLGGLAVLPPLFEIHKQLVLLAIAIFQIFERAILRSVRPRLRGVFSVLLKILLGTLLVGHTGDIPINSSYYLIYYLPVVSAAMLFGPWATLLWTALASAAYLSFLLPALQEFELTTSGATELAIRVLFFFLAAVVVNRFLMEYRSQVMRYQMLAETLAETNRRLEQAQADARRSERLAALGRLSAGLAHELRNPLGVIEASAETLIKKQPSSVSLTGELGGYILSEVNRLDTLVSRFLNFARPFKLDLRPQEITSVVEAALKAVHDRWPDAKVEVERHYAENLPQVAVDADLCEQVFTNLVINAYEAMPEGGKLRMSVARSNSDGRPGVEIEVGDTGPGIPAELREEIFNPFFTTKKNGVGLGLSIVSKIVDDHGGHIRVTSEPGQGACFRVFLPA
jgi:signal transduction histidine kinase